jgi:hypothetical protein
MACKRKCKDCTCDKLTQWITMSNQAQLLFAVKIITRKEARQLASIDEILKSNKKRKK